ncbi:MAG: zinc-ribbon domain-containing protein [Pyrinomonadaceae bacterium]|nr:zinc-ribbon domain-containing protein [Blastocatellia bacterium]MCW5956281.1 zinc-ribbon domain-containing protein [Pyrinomonadaceae bacterium]
MIIRCDNCSVSLQLDESKIPSGNFTVRCPRCQNMLRANKDLKGNGSPTVQQLEANKPAAPAEAGSKEFAEKQSDFEINSALKMLLHALKTGNEKIESADDTSQKPRRVLLCLGERKDEIAKQLTESGYRVYVAQTPAQANERLREGKTEIVIFSPDFAPEYGGAAILQQKANAMYSSERRRMFLVSLEDEGTTMNAHEAFLRNLNLVVNTGDIPQLPLILNRALMDFNDLYYYMNSSLGLEPI